ncbi:hypothetical protein FPHYL_2013 [Fusarium phyllophilum]|uniref:Uncharacterized protein n=1 Tax=Fusarium phyllophilum TaxID=47803 RepID=A0A8H5NMH6_9HYPO|nr:hypothetical protein FPHYL_2013 [Fusarium phyllophilum]
MFSQYKASKTTIRRHYVVNLLTGDGHEDLLQDALGLLHLELSDKRPDNHVMKYTIRQWNSKTLPNPFEEKDQATISKLYKLFSSMNMFVEDYISKATSSNPPQAYLCLPQIDDPNRGLYYKDHSFSPRHVTLDDLTSSECHSLIRAFIKYDMFCKIQAAKVALPTDDNEYSAISKKAFDELTNCLGFDLIRDLVRFANKAQPEDMRSWFYTIFSRWQKSQDMLLHNYRFPSLDNFWTNLVNHRDGSLRSLQRAWVFLDDTRLLQTGLDHFPAVEDLEKHRFETIRAAERQRLRRLQLCRYRREAGIEDAQNKGREYIFKANDEDSIPRFFDQSGNSDVTTFWQRI